MQNQQTQADKRDQIVTAAEYLFSTKGFGNTQIAEIAKRAGTGISTFYRHFEDKDALLEELLERLFHDLRTRLVAERAGIETRSPLEQLSVIRRTHEIVFDALLSRPALTRTLFSSGFGAGERIAAQVHGYIERIAADVGADIARAQREGLVHVDDLHAFGHAIVGMVLQLAHTHLVSGRPSREQAVDTVTHFVLGALTIYMPHETFAQYGALYHRLVASPAAATPRAVP
jgi:AcrR family transcriptional regulator